MIYSQKESPVNLLSWNCNRGDIAAKLEKVGELKPDVAFIQEARKPKKLLAHSQLWAGDNDKQGVAAFGFNGYHIRPCQIHADTPPTTLPFFVDGPECFFALGIWAKPAPTYVEHTWKSLDLYADIIKSNPAVLIGDLNSNSFWDAKYKKYNHSMLVDRLLKEFNLVSVYHTFYDLEHGAELHPTIYWMHHPAKPYHLDYCFVPREWIHKLGEVIVTDYQSFAGVSDHRPIVAQISSD